MTSNSLNEIVSQLKNIKSAAIFCHARPDGDALGAGLALLTALLNEGKHAVMCCEDLPPEKFSFLPSMRNVKTALPADKEFDTLICVDSADVSRIGTFADAFVKFAGTTLNIDHHVSNKGYAKYNYVCECPATCELLTEIIFEAGFKITEEVANLLMLGLITAKDMSSKFG